MRKSFFSVLSAVGAVCLSSLVLLTSADKKISMLLQRFLPPRESPVPVVLVSADDAFLEKNGSAEIADSVLADMLSAVRELGAAGYALSVGAKNPVVAFDSFVERAERHAAKERKMPFLNATIVFQGASDVETDTKTPELSHRLLPFPHSFGGREVFLGDAGCFEAQYSSQLVVKSGGSYYAAPTFVAVLEAMGNPAVKITNSSIILKSPSVPADLAGTASDSLVIPRSGDGSVRLVFPRGSWRDYPSVSACDVYDFLEKERQLGDALRSSENEGELELESEVNSLRERLFGALRGSFCVFALTARPADTIATPFDSDFPRPVLCYVLAHMIFARNFVSDFPPAFSVLIALALCLCLSLFALRVRKSWQLLLISLFALVLCAFAFACVAVYFRLFVGCAVPLVSLALLSLVLNLRLLGREKKTALAISNHFLQCIPESTLRAIVAEPSAVPIDGQRAGLTVVATAIQNYGAIRALLNENQLVAFLNYYFEKVSASILAYGGTVESYRGEEIIAVFGAPLPLEGHCVCAARASCAIKGCDRLINEGIVSYPLLPKPDGMSDDLYTTFFILNHNQKRVSTRIGLYAAESIVGCLGSEAKKSFRIVDDSWKAACELRDSALHFASAGIMLNGAANELVKNDFIVRNLGSFTPETEGADSTLHELLGDRRDDDDKLWNYANYWNQAEDLLEKGEKEKSLAIFKKLAEGGPSDSVAAYFIKSINGVE